MLFESHVPDWIALPLSQLTDKKMRLIGARMIAVTESLLSLRHSSDLATLSKALQVGPTIHTYIRTYMRKIISQQFACKLT